ncbi:bifunctional enoyl-CoA hydratase/phosphate acetyltransferase [Kiloniella laminariae]|uniref:Bifunctional enoyl-CoA hydratase/phosphate acetyltransferase n=1 Tax=Kiloniella laminariae TaxID=454162 RepID=A0ABT4LMX6_9PROT|nr:bifunctional enoyl-CoA hydratase/phosphate acetyltransferase [Kiloniella laminariae]MCZ4282490.1 bifunctional enoyl-CoA hydratase/phosphate acetyltransferase [Kiloniella laminariae]
MLSQHPVECPITLINSAAAHGPIRTAIVNAVTPIAMESAFLAARARLIEPVLIGNKETIKTLAAEFEWETCHLEIHDASDEEAAAACAVELARNKMVGALMKGQIHTDIFMKAIIDRSKGLRREGRLSHAFYMSVPDSDRIVVITDAAINIAPDLETKKSIILNAVKMLHALGNKHPKVAILSASEEENPRIPSSMEAAELTRWAKTSISNADVFGPMALDNAISPEAARIKGIENAVAGQADILVVPNIETGNALFKQLVYCDSACAAGVVLGASVPIVLTSRADPPAARLASMAIATIVAQYV